MFCNHCKQDFDERLNIPRLLTVCGHSLCESCCYRLHISNRVQCPECRSSTFVQSIALLPKNLALISRLSQRDLCVRHHKKYEAFCEKENMLICIECILQDGHKSHEMDSILNCYQKHYASWQRKMDRFGKYCEKMGQGLGDCRKQHEEYRETYSGVREAVGLLFKEMREIIDREEQAVLVKVREAYTQSDAKFQEKTTTITNSIASTSALSEQLQIFKELSQIQFLQTYSRREDLYNSYPQQLEEVVKPIPLTFNRKAIIQNLSKCLQISTLQKSQKKTPTTSVASYSSINTQIKKTSEGSSATIKGVRKMPTALPQPATPPLNISNQNKKKVSSNKKQATSQNQGCLVISKILTSPKQKSQNTCRNVTNQIRSDLSAVDPKQSLCHSFMSNMTSFLSERKSIYLIGGFNEQANSIVKLNLFSFNWQQVCLLNSNRSKFGSIAVDKQIYLFGGKKGKERVSDSEVYNTATNKWSRFTPMNKNRSGFAVVALGQVLYFIGGNDGDNILSTVQTYNTATGEWKKKESMHEARDELAAVVGKNNKIYAIGGFGGKDNQPLRSVEVFDPKTERWKAIPSMNQPRRALAAAVLADGIYAIGGFDGTMYMSSVQKYEEGEKQWSYVASMSQSRCTHSAVSIFQSQEIYVFGGFDYVPLDSVQRYNVISNEWEQICRMPHARFMHSSLLLKEE